MIKEFIQWMVVLMSSLMLSTGCTAGESGKLEASYSPYIDEPSAAAVAYFEEHPELFDETDRIQAKRTPAVIEYLVRKDNEKVQTTKSPKNNPYKDEKIPYYMQWDQRWAFRDYAGGKFGQTGCGPTVLSMIYSGVSGDRTYTPDKMSEFAVEHGYSTKNNGTSWTFMSEGARELGLNVKELPLHKGSIDQALRNGQPIILILGPGDFTSGGHYIILRGITDAGYEIYDPFSLPNTQKTWTYAQLEGQIRNIWAYSN